MEHVLAENKALKKCKKAEVEKVKQTHYKRCIGDSDFLAMRWEDNIKIYCRESSLGSCPVVVFELAVPNFLVLLSESWLMNYGHGGDENRWDFRTSIT
jgi:hypothetical protein